MPPAWLSLLGFHNKHGHVTGNNTVSSVPDRLSAGLVFVSRLSVRGCGFLIDTKEDKKP